MKLCDSLVGDTASTEPGRLGKWPSFLWISFLEVQSITPPPQRLLVKILTHDVTRCLDHTHIFLTTDRLKALECVFLQFRHALLVWQSKCFIRDRHEVLRERFGHIDSEG